MVAMWPCWQWWLCPTLPPVSPQFSPTSPLIRYTAQRSPPASWQYTAQPPLGCWRVELCVFVEMVKLAVQKKVCNGALSPLVAAAGWRSDAVTRLCKYSANTVCNNPALQCEERTADTAWGPMTTVASWGENNLSLSRSTGVMWPSMAHKWSSSDLSEHRSCVMWTRVKEDLCYCCCFVLAVMKLFLMTSWLSFCSRPICQIPLHDIHIHNHNATNNVFSLCKYCYYCSYDPSKCECGWLRAIITLSKV